VGHEAPVEPTRTQKTLVRPNVNEPTLVEDEDLIGVAYRG
jgi:hypothetical protein